MLPANTSYEACHFKQGGKQFRHGVARFRVRRVFLIYSFVGYTDESILDVVLHIYAIVLELDN